MIHRASAPGDRQIPASNSSSANGSGVTPGPNAPAARLSIAGGAVRSVCSKHWFLLGVGVAITCARLYPWLGSDAGPLYPRVTVKYGAVVAIFLISGMSLRTDQMKGAVTNIPMHCFIQGFTLVVVPVVMKLVVVPLLLLIGLPTDLAQGFMAVGCMPPPVSSAVILTKSVGGNEAAAIFNSAFGSLLGVVITPLELMLFIDQSNQHPLEAGELGDPGAAEPEAGSSSLLLKVFFELSATVLVPLVVGQLLRPRIGEKVDAVKSQLSVLSSCTLLLIIYTTFCNTFCPEGACSSSFLDLAEAGSVTQVKLGAEELAVNVAGTRALATAMPDPMAQVSSLSLATAGVSVVMIQAVFMLAVFLLSSRYAEAFRFSRADIVAVLFCSVHKSLTLGVPVLKIVFASSPALSLLTLPILMYHPAQIVLGGLLAPVVRSWMLAGSREDVATTAVKREFAVLDQL